MAQYFIDIIDHKLTAICLQLDVLDYIKILDTIGDSLDLSDLLDTTVFDGCIRNLSSKIKRGDYVMCLTSVFGSENYRETVRRQQKFIYQGFLIFKIGGWKNVLFTTQNPIPFLKINADVVAESPD